MSQQWTNPRNRVLEQLLKDLRCSEETFNLFGRLLYHGPEYPFPLDARANLDGRQPANNELLKRALRPLTGLDVTGTIRLSLIFWMEEAPEHRQHVGPFTKSYGGEGRWLAELLEATFREKLVRVLPASSAARRRIPNLLEKALYRTVHHDEWEGKVNQNPNARFFLDAIWASVETSLRYYLSFVYVREEKAVKALEPLVRLIAGVGYVPLCSVSDDLSVWYVACR